MKKIIAFLTLFLVITASAGKWRKKVPQSTYSENLAVHRKQFHIPQEGSEKPPEKWKNKKKVSVFPLHSVTAQLEHLLERKKAANKRVKFIQGYTIQVYTGGSRDLAFKARNKLYTYLPNATPEVHYDLPNYTVRIGKFLDKEEAYPMYAAVKKRIPQAIIRPISFANTANLFSHSSAEEQTDAVHSEPATNEHE